MKKYVLNKRRSGSLAKRDKDSSRWRFAGMSTLALLLAARVVLKRGRRFSLDGKIIAITGGSRGLGLALAEECLKAHAYVALIARDEAELDRAKRRLVSRGYDSSHVRVICCDVTDTVQVADMVRSVSVGLGPIDVLINNAGVITVGPFETQTLEHYEQAMRTNFFGALSCTLAVLPGMVERRDGHVVNIASIGGIVSVPHLLPYSASKFALVGFSRGLSNEFRWKGVGVLTVNPWLMRTGSHLQALFSGSRADEYRWFSLGAALPLVSVDAQIAAKRIVSALVRGEEEIFASPLSWLAAASTNVAPALTGLALAIMNTLLPKGKFAEESTLKKGWDSREHELQLAKHYGDRSAVEWNQHPRF